MLRSTQETHSSSVRNCMAMPRREAVRPAVHKRKVSYQLLAAASSRLLASHSIVVCVPPLQTLALLPLSSCCAAVLCRSRYKESIGRHLVSVSSTVQLNRGTSASIIFGRNVETRSLDTWLSRTHQRIAHWAIHEKSQVRSLNVTIQVVF